MLAGTWHGVLRMRAPLPVASDTGLPDEAPVELLIQHTDKKLRVLLRQQGQWMEAMPGGFQAVPMYSNLVLLGAQSEGNPTPLWIESWTLQMAALDDDCALVEWTRAVTNVPAASGKKPAFTSAASGTMCRAGAVP